MKYNIKILIIVIVVLTGCTKFLEEAPSKGGGSGQLITSVEDLELLAYSYDAQNEVGFAKCDLLIPFQSSDSHIYTEALIENLSGGVNVFPSLEQEAFYRWDDKVVLDVDVGEANSYEAYYKNIGVTNILLSEGKRIENSKDIVVDKSILHQIYGEAYYHRAFNHFMLVNVYSKQYNKQSANSDLGIPIRTTTDINNVKLNRNSVQEVYNTIVQDLNESIKYLQFNSKNDSKGNPFRVTKAAANGLLSRVYLYMQDYNNALKYSNESLNLYSELINYDTYSELNTYRKEHSWAFDSVPNTYGDPYQNGAFWEWKENLYPYDFGEWSWNICRIDNKILSLFEKGDTRSNFTKIKDTTLKFNEQQQFPDVGIVYHIMFGRSGLSFTTSEQYLIRAECNARLGNIGEALNDLNHLKSHRFTATEYKDITLANEQDIIKYIIDERLREFPLSYHRWFDLKRMNEDPNKIYHKSIIREYKGYRYTLEAGTNRWAHPIPQRYILLNPEMKQNPTGGVKKEAI